MSEEHLVYALCDPITCEIRYIGQAVDVFKRYAQHLVYERYNQAKTEWLDRLKSIGKLPTLIILESNIVTSMISEREMYWISYYLQRGEKLTNIVTPGEPPCRRKKSIAKPLPTENIDVIRQSSAQPPMPMEQTNHIYTAAEVAKLFQLSKKLVNKFAERGELTGIPFGKEWRFRESDIDAYIARQLQKAQLNSRQFSS